MSIHSAGVAAHIEFTEDSIHICDDKGEIVMWTQQEWVEDPEVVMSIVNAVRMVCTYGPSFLRKTIENEH